MRILRLLAPVLAALSLVSCGDDDKGTPADKWFAAYANALCDGYAKCCAAAGEPNDITACQQFMGYLGGMSVSAAISNGATFDQAAGDQCLADVSTFFATCPVQGSEPDSCKRVIVGTHAAGQPCSNDYDCAFGPGETASCYWTSSSSGGDSTQTCRIEKPAAVGQPCSSSSAGADPNVFYRCSEDPAFYCDMQSDTCQKRVAIGGACAGTGSCTDDAYCAVDTSICTARLQVGESCDQYSANCVSDAWCNTTTLKCEARKPAGATCTGWSECLGFCNGNSICEGSSGTTMCFTNSSD